MIDTLTTLPMMVKVLASLGLILACNRLVGNLAVSVFLGAASLAAFSGRTGAASAQIATGRLLSPDHGYLMLVVLLVIGLSNQMSEAGVMRDLVEVIRRRLGRRHAMAALPALIGFLPMPGGAVFSAPLVEGCDAAGTTAAIDKTRVNYWFRHVWEFWWPLYPGVLLAMHLTGVDVWQFMLLGLPLTAAAVASGYIFVLRGVAREIPGAPDAAPSGAPSAARLLSPIFTVVGGYALFRLAFGAARLVRPDLPGVNRYVPMLFGVLLAMLVLDRWRPLSRSAWRRIVLSKKTLGMVLVIAAVQVYGAFVDAPLPGGGNPVVLMHAEMERWGIPVVAMVMLLPFIGGLTTGVAIGFVGVSFPVVVSLMGVDPPLRTVLAFTVLAYACGHMGQMLSPVHICLVVTNEHFKTGLMHSLRGLLAPAAVVILTALAIHTSILRWL
jgi:hypothetical protein